MFNGLDNGGGTRSNVRIRRSGIEGIENLWVDNIAGYPVNIGGIRQYCHVMDIDRARERYL
jgi:hypothetical protein